MNRGRRMSVAWLWLAPLLLVVLVALIQWLPLITLTDTGFAGEEPADRPYTPLELRGRDIYLREGCSTCHSQLVRLQERDLARFGRYSRAAESRFDHPTQWGEKRYGPDLARIGGKYPDSWHARHLAEPRSVVAESTMPGYAWLAGRRLSYAGLPNRMRTLRRIGTPYSLTTAEYEANARDFGAHLAGYYDIFRAEASLLDQAGRRDYDGDPSRLTEMDALIAYLQIIGVAVQTAPQQWPAIASADRPWQGKRISGL